MPSLCGAGHVKCVTHIINLTAKAGLEVIIFIIYIYILFSYNKVDELQDPTVNAVNVVIKDMDTVEPSHSDTIDTRTHKSDVKQLVQAPDVYTNILDDNNSTVLAILDANNKSMIALSKVIQQASAAALDALPEIIYRKNNNDLLSIVDFERDASLNYTISNRSVIHPTYFSISYPGVETDVSYLKATYITPVLASTSAVSDTFGIVSKFTSLNAALLSIEYAIKKYNNVFKIRCARVLNYHSPTNAINALRPEVTDTNILDPVPSKNRVTLMKLMKLFIKFGI